MSLCAVAVFSFTAGGNAHAEAVTYPGSDVQSTEPVAIADRTNPPPSIGPVPPVAPSIDMNGVVQSGTFSGTLMAD